jgi:hypothetical protein
MATVLLIVRFERLLADATLVAVFRFDACRSFMDDDDHSENEDTPNTS